MRRITDLRELKDSELETELANMQDEIFKLRFKHATGQLDNSSRLRQVRKDIARLHTLMREREIKAAETADTEMKSGAKKNASASASATATSNASINEGAK